MKNRNNQLLKLWFLQATEALCHLCVTDIKKTFCNIWFFCKNQACANCTGWNATTVIWLPWGYSYQYLIYIARGSFLSISIPTPLWHSYLVMGLPQKDWVLLPQDPSLSLYVLNLPFLDRHTTHKLVSKVMH